MRINESMSVRRSWVWTAVVASAVILSSTNCWGQAAPAATKADEKAAAAESAAKAPADEPAAKADEKAAATKTAAEATPPAVAATPASAPATASAPPEKDAPASTVGPAEKADNSSSSMPAGKTDDSLATKALEKTGAADKTGVPAEQASAQEGWNVWVLGLTLLALFVLPIMVGNYLATMWRMPDHAWKISLTLGVTAGAILICLFGQFKYGPDLAGGITLIYELSDTPQTVAETNPSQANPNAPKQIKSGGREFKITELIGALKKRLDPDGTKEITIREYGPAVEIIIPQVGQDEMDFVKQKITALGQLEFRITADPNIPKDKTKIDLAKLVPPTQKDVMQGEDKVAKWVPYDVKEFGPVDRADGYVKRQAGDTAEVLVLMDPMNVTGDYLTSATKGIDEHGGPAVHFAFNSAGAQRFEKLTGQNVPNPATPDVYRHLGILLDNTLVNAPTIRSAISERGMISGGSMSDREVDLNVEILNAGSLPAALNKEPISQEIISATLGGQTVQEAKRAITASLLAVVLFMLVYYRFAGVVACVVLTLNLVMVLALMVLIRAAFTLPGLAGLALTVGMSVDANVLIYERIREELENGTALRMAIRNGFSRALTAIIDTNLTSIISGVVLFYIGTDQVKGFAVTLVLGILTSLFTAVFVARLIFDVSERQGWIKHLHMMHIFSKPNFDFLRLRWVMLGLSWALIAVGMVAVYFRGSQLLDIDFTGGSSVTFTLNDKDQMSLIDVRDALIKTELADKNLLIVERGANHTNYTVDTSEQQVDHVKGVLQQEFGEKLKKYSLDFSDLKPFTEGGISGTEATLAVNSGAGYHPDESGMSLDALRQQILTALEKQKKTGVQITLTNPNYKTGSNARYAEWNVKLGGLDEAATREVLGVLKIDMGATPLFPLASTIGGRVSSDMRFHAIYAIAISIVTMILYLWFRFQSPAYGIAAGIALIHDILMTVGMIALSYYIVIWIPGLASLLKIEAFQINLTIVAALLTIIGYSVHDSIITFDRLREIKGKSPLLSANMVNDSINQTLSRTILTVFTVFIVIVILYFFGGEGLHSFAYAFMVGIVVGTYSSIYVASPILLWLSGVSAAPVPQAPAANTRGMQPAR